MKGKKAYRMSAFYRKEKGGGGGGETCLDCLHFFLYRKRIYRFFLLLNFCFVFSKTEDHTIHRQVIKLFYPCYKNVNN